MSTEVVVKKFGGSMLKNDRDYEQVANSILSDLNQFKQVIILSAPFRHTDHLLKESLSITSQPDPKFQALLLATGEQISLAKIGLFLQKKSVCVDYLYATQIPLYTKPDSLDALVQTVDKKKILTSLEKNDVVLVAGFQGLDLVNKRLTTIGRGGSDLTASVISAALKCPCFFFKDSGGIGKSFQNQYEKIYSNLTFNELVELSQNGSKVIYDQAALLLSQYKVPTYFGSINHPQRTEVLPISKHKIDNIIHSKNCFRAEIKSKSSIGHLISSTNFKKKFYLLGYFLTNKKKYLVFEKKHNESLDKSYFYEVNSFNLGTLVPVSVIHITGNGLLNKPSWFFELSETFEHKISSIIFNQFKVSIIMDDISSEDTLKLVNRLNHHVSQFVSS